MIEIYNKKLNDLLNDSSEHPSPQLKIGLLDPRKSKQIISILSLKEILIDSVELIWKIQTRGSHSSAISAARMNGKVLFPILFNVFASICSHDELKQNRTESYIWLI